MKSWNILDKDTLQVVARCGTRKSTAKYVRTHPGTISEPAMATRRRPAVKERAILELIHFLKFGEEYI